MNAGMNEVELWNFIENVTLLNMETLEKKEFKKDQIKHGYRSTQIQTMNSIITNITLKLNQGYSAEIEQKMLKTKENRREKQPYEYPNAGSVFKRPEGHFVGKLIQDLNLKGFRIGDAQISEKHAGFIVNRGGATGAGSSGLESSCISLTNLARISANILWWTA